MRFLHKSGSFSFPSVSGVGVLAEEQEMVLLFFCSKNMYFE